MVINLKDETLAALRACHKDKGDIKWIGGADFKISIDDFWKLADKEYNNESRNSCVARDLVICGDTWWLERDWDDYYSPGSECWIYCEIPKEPEYTLNVQNIIKDDDDGWWPNLYDFLDDVPSV